MFFSECIKRNVNTYFSFWEQTRGQVETAVPDTFTCNDGKVIPSSYLMDGGCDCESCEDEESY